MSLNPIISYHIIVRCNMFLYDVWSYNLILQYIAVYSSMLLCNMHIVSNDYLLLHIGLLLLVLILYFIVSYYTILHYIKICYIRLYQIISIQFM